MEYLDVVQIWDGPSRWWHRYAYGPWNWAWKAYFTDPKTDVTLVEYAQSKTEAIAKLKHSILTRRRGHFRIAFELEGTE